MITVKYAQFKDPAFQEAVGKLKHVKGLPMYTNYDVVKLLKWLKEQEPKAHHTLQKILSSYIDKNVDGSRKVLPDGTPSVQEEKKEEFQRKLEEWGNTKVAFDWRRIKASHLERAGLTPEDLMSLEEFIELDEPEVKPPLHLA